MLGSVKCALSLAIFAMFINFSFAGERKFNLGQLASKKEIAGWDIDIRPDGKGAPVGQGKAIDGEKIYIELCASCHGDFGEGIDRWPVLVGGESSLNTYDPQKTTGSYWPYASTIYDYVYRAMPFGAAQSLSHDETYKIVAYLLYMNEIIDEEFILSEKNIGKINMPNKNGFLLPDPRPDVAGFSSKTCMSDCDVPTKIIGKARDIDVTPEKN
ncbi:MAG: c-type cytochrome [Rhodospirillales bacterium]|tara:strand:- start:3781 stop:4419 length:639 start_codon:yes stop_codon:yes gene_type:complete